MLGNWQMHRLVYDRARRSLQAKGQENLTYLTCQTIASNALYTLYYSQRPVPTCFQDLAAMSAFASYDAKALYFMLHGPHAIGLRTRGDKMHRRFRLPATLACLSAFFLLGFSSHVNETTGASPGLFAAVPEAGTVTVTGKVYYPNRNGNMREAWSVRVRLYDYQWTEMSPRYVWLADTYTDDAGAFAFPPITNYDGLDYGDPDTRLDLFIVVEPCARESGGSYSEVTYFNGVSYKWNEPGPCPGCYPTGLVGCPRWDDHNGLLY
jgi:hypothetical protein